MYSKRVCDPFMFFLNVFSNRTHQERVIQDRIDCTQFVLTAVGSSKGRPCVEVPNPVESAALPLKTVYDEFTPSREGFGRSFFGWLEGEQPQGMPGEYYNY